MMCRCKTCGKFFNKEEAFEFYDARGIKFYLCSYSCCDKYIFDSNLKRNLPPLPPAPPSQTYKEGLFGIRKRVITAQDKMYERSKQMYRYIDYMTS